MRWMFWLFAVGIMAQELLDDLAPCVPSGHCEPCPEAALHEPFCQPFGNRQLLHCQSKGSQPGLGEELKWIGCGRVVEQETRDFWEFLLCNVAIAVVALFVVVARLRSLDATRSRNLAARIGLYRR